MLNTFFQRDERDVHHRADMSIDTYKAKRWFGVTKEYLPRQESEPAIKKVTVCMFIV